MVRRLLMAIGLLAFAAPALAADLAVVNGTGGAILKLSIRPYGGGAWKSVEGSLSSGARRTISSPTGDCAFDIRGELAGGAQATWAGVNFCEAKAVTLNRRPDGTTWADYD